MEEKEHSSVNKIATDLFCPKSPTSLFTFKFRIMDTQIQEIGKARTLSSEYENDTAMMLFSAIAYCSVKFNVADSVRHYFGTDWEIVWDSREHGSLHYAFIAYNKSIDTHVVSIRGTLSDLSFNSVKNWIEDFEVLREFDWNYPYAEGARVSHGAHKGMKDLTELKDTKQNITMYKYLNTPESNVKNLWVTGHSLGAALATLYASWLHFELKVRPTFNVVTFAGPTVGNAAFTAQFNSKFKNNSSRSYVNVLDAVHFMAGSVDKILTLFDGSKYGPKGSDIPIVRSVFTDLYEAINRTERNCGFYTPVDTVIPLNTKQKLFEVEVDEKDPSVTWLRQVGAQHSHAHYLNFMNWGHGDFNCQGPVRQEK